MQKSDTTTETIIKNKGGYTMPHRTKIKDKDPVFEVDTITRLIKSKSTSKTTVIQYDHNSERFTFSLPRFVEGHDMMESKAEVHYTTAKEGIPGLYVMTDLHIDAEDESKVVCTWLLSQNVTMEPGAIKFSLRFSCVDDAGEIIYAWNTAPFVGISVTPGIYNADAIVEQYADVLEQWHKEIMDAIANIQISGGAVQSDWNEENPESLAYILNKPNIPARISDLVDDTEVAERIKCAKEAQEAFADGKGRLIHDTYATKEELSAAIGEALEGDY